MPLERVFLLAEHLADAAPWASTCKFIYVSESVLDLGASVKGTSGQFKSLMVLFIREGHPFFFSQLLRRTLASLIR